MATLRETYFNALKIKKDFISKSDIYDILLYVNRLNSYSDLTINFDNQLKSKRKFNYLFNRINNGEMVQYVLNKANFLDKEYFVNKSVLIPRQETEQLVYLTIEYIKNKFDSNLTIADVCCGSGIIGISIKNEFPDSDVYLTDISKKALKVTDLNCKKYGQNNTLLAGDLIKPLLKNDIRCDVLVCNPPYIDDVNEVDQRTLTYEPKLALFAYPKTKHYERIIKNIDKIMKPHFLIAFEIEENSKEALIDILSKYHYENDFRFVKDIYQKDRFLFIIK